MLHDINTQLVKKSKSSNLAPPRFQKHHQTTNSPTYSSILTNIYTDSKWIPKLRQHCFNSIRACVQWREWMCKSFPRQVWLHCWSGVSTVFIIFSNDLVSLRCCGTKFLKEFYRKWVDKKWYMYTDCVRLRRVLITNHVLWDVIQWTSPHKSQLSDITKYQLTNYLICMFGLNTPIIIMDECK